MKHSEDTFMVPDGTLRQWILLLRRELLITAAAAFLLRALNVWSIVQSPIGETVVLDARAYFTEAGRILGYFSAADEGVRFMNLGYPYVIAAVCAVAGYHVSAMLWMQTLAGTAVSLLVALAAYAVTSSRRAALLAGLLSAGYAGGLFYDAALLTPSFIQFFVALSLLSAIIGVSRGSIPAMVLSGIGAGAASLLRANSLLLILALIIIAAVVVRSVGMRRFLLAASLTAGASAVILPPIAVNGMVYGEWVPLTANGGMNFWVGNNSNANGMYAAAPFLASQSIESEQESFRSEAVRRTGDSAITLSAMSAYWRDQAWNDIAADPLRWGTLIVRKLWLGLNGYEIQTNISLSFFRRFSPVLQYTPVTWAFLLPLGTAGILLLRRKHTVPALLLTACAGVYLATMLIFFVSGEYRHPAAIPLLIGTAVTIETVISLLRTRTATRRADRSGMLRQFASAVAAAAVLSVPAFWTDDEIRRISDPFYSHTNYAQAQYRKIEQGHTPSPEEFRRAVLLLETAVPKPHQELILWEVFSRTYFFSAVSYGNSEEAKRSLLYAQRIFAADLNMIGPLYDAQFLRFLYTNAPMLVREIVKDERFRADPEVRRYAERAHQLFVSNRTLIPLLQPNR